MSKKLKIILFYILSISNSFSASQYLEVPTGVNSANGESLKYINLSNWAITAFVGVSILACGLTAGSYARNNEYTKAAGPIAGAVIIAICTAWALNK